MQLTHGQELNSTNEQNISYQQFYRAIRLGT